MDSLSFVYSNPQTVRTSLLEYLESNGFDIVMKHATGSTRQRQFLVGVAKKTKEGVILKMFNNSYKAHFEYSPDRQLVDLISTS
jgi:hypothetical protein